MPACGALGNAGLLRLRGPRAVLWGCGIFKNFTVTERVKMQFRMDAFNLFNHPVMGFNTTKRAAAPVSIAAAMGNITGIELDASPGSTTGMRQLEFALRLMF